MTLWRLLRGRPRFFLSFGLGVVAGFLLPDHWRLATRMLIGWDIALIVYLVSMTRMIIRYRHEDVRERAQELDEGRYFVLALSLAAVLFALGAIFTEIGPVKALEGSQRTIQLVLTGLTILLSWFFTHFVFMLYYAHEYYLERDELTPQQQREGRQALKFPGTDVPDYLDFLYFSFIIGVASQTADVSICSKPVRLVSLGHSIVSFFFNTSILALTINLAAGLF